MLITFNRSSVEIGGDAILSHMQFLKPQILLSNISVINAQKEIFPHRDGGLVLHSYQGPEKICNVNAFILFERWGFYGLPDNREHTKAAFR